MYLIKKLLASLIVKTLSLLVNPNKKDILDKLEYYLLLANGKYRGSYNLDFEVKISSDLIKKIHKLNKKEREEKKRGGGGDIEAAKKNFSGTIIDVGANKGDYFFKIKNNFPAFTYYLFEPQKKLYNILNKKIFDKKIKIYNFGLSDANKSIKFYNNKLFDGLGSFLNRKHEIKDNKIYKFQTSYNLNVKRFDQLDIYIKDIDLIKIDVEGYEFNVLKGFGNFLNKTKIIQFEWGRAQLDAKCTFLDFWILLKKFNFDIYRIYPRGLKKINKYSWYEEMYIASNFICVNRNIVKNFFI